jgi:hypothetical protein
MHTKFWPDNFHIKYNSRDNNAETVILKCGLKGVWKNGQIQMSKNMREAYHCDADKKVCIHTP